jgi:KipI family sensor histidine kinase inhibitor
VTTSLRFRPVGERAVLVEVAGNAAARGLAAFVRRRLADVVEDVVPGHETVLVIGRTGRPRLDALAGWTPQVEAEAGERTVEIEVRYDGPDLAEVAAECGLTPDEVAARHQAPLYTVAFLGFAPGFAYLTGGDDALRPPRLATPRARVPGGAVALAGEYSGVYPRESPGGWRLIGSTRRVLFDPDHDPPSLLSAGDRVRFTASDA